MRSFDRDPESIRCEAQRPIPCRCATGAVDAAIFGFDKLNRVLSHSGFSDMIISI